jgi:hypothetical protein
MLFNGNKIYLCKKIKYIPENFVYVARLFTKGG